MKGKMKNDINVKGSGEMRRYEREKGWRSVNVKLKNIYIYILKIIIRKWKEKR